MKLIFLTFEIFHFDISGNEDNLEQLKNIELILLTFEVFHADISGNRDNFVQYLNMELIFSTLIILMFTTPILINYNTQF